MEKTHGLLIVIFSSIMMNDSKCNNSTDLYHSSNNNYRRVTGFVQLAVVKPKLSLLHYICKAAASASPSSAIGTQFPRLRFRKCDSLSMQGPVEGVLNLGSLNVDIAVWYTLSVWSIVRYNGPIADP